MENSHSQFHHATSNSSFSQQWRNLQSSISTFEASMAEQVNELQSKEREITEVAKTVENSQKEVELRENSLREKLKEVDTREKQVSSKIEACEVKMQQIEEICKGLQLKCRETMEMKAKLMEEIKVKEVEIDERCKSLDCREREIEEKSRVLEVKVKELNFQELKVDKIEVSPTVAQSAQTKTREPQPESCCELQLLCRNMDARGVKSYLIEHFEDLNILLKKIFNSLQLAPDPVKLVLDVIQSLYKLMHSDNVSRQVYTCSCIVLSATLLKLNVNIAPQLKDDARKFSIMWRDAFTKQGNAHPVEVFAFLHFIASYKLAQSYDANELLSLLGTFYTESEVLSLEQDSYLCRLLGLKKKIPGVIKSLILKEEQLRAVVYICAFKMEDAFPPIPLLKAHLECIQTRVQEMVNQGTDTAQNDAVNMELSSLKAVLKCISNFKLESIFSPAPLQSRIKQLVKEREENATADSLMALKKNFSKSEKEYEALCSSNPSHSEIVKRHTSTSIESQRRAKHPKVDAC